MFEAGVRSIKKGGYLLRDRIGGRYLFIDAEKKTYPISLMCDVLDVRRGGYYGWMKHDKSIRQREYDKLIPVDQEAHRLSKGTYGARRIAEEITARGTPCGRTKAATIMKFADFAASQKKQFNATTESKYDLPVAPNLLNREFKVES